MKQHPIPGNWRLFPAFSPLNSLTNLKGKYLPTFWGNLFTDFPAVGYCTNPPKSMIYMTRARISEDDSVPSNGKGPNLEITEAANAKQLLNTFAVLQQQAQSCPNPSSLPSYKKRSYHVHCSVTSAFSLIWHRQKSSLNYPGRMTKERWSPALLVREK